jgi:hypothetical protein
VPPHSQPAARHVSLPARADSPSRGIARLLLIVAACAWPAAPVGAQASRAASAPVSVSADLRGRFESDVDSRREDGTLRPDRHRARSRGRLELRGRPARSLTLLGRIRTGSPDSQQSPHLTVHDFSGGSADRFTVVPDRYLVQYAGGRVESWVGRNEFPFWSQNELFWDRDVTLPGGFLSYTAPVARASLQLRGGYFGLPDGALDVRGRMAAGQASVSSRLAGSWSMQGAVGLFDMRGASRTSHLLSGNGRRDYRIGVGSLQITRDIKSPRVRALRLGADLFSNFHDYRDAADPQALAFRKARTGVVLMTTVAGGARANERGAWEAGYTFARVEKLAVNASYAQDDWVRWGSATQTDSSNLEGHEASGRYWLSRDLDLQARAFFVQSITTPQDGTRIRLDLNWRVALVR